MILKIRSGGPNHNGRDWTFFDEAVEVGIRKEYKESCCFGAVPNNDFRFEKCEGSSAEAEYFFMAHMNQGQAQERTIVFTEGYLLNNDGKTVERFN